MFFLLGCLTAGLVALMILPAIRRRAVRLTRRDLQATMPTTHAEFEAQKDQLRAEFAVTNSRLQRRVDTLSREKNRQDMDLNARIEEARVLATEVDDKSETIDDLEETIAGLRRELRKRTEELSDVSSKRRESARLLMSASERRKEMEVEIADLKSELGDRKVDLAAHVSRIESLEEVLADDRAKLSSGAAELGSLESELRQRDARLASEEGKVRGLQKRIERLTADLADRDDALERRSTELNQLRELMKSDGRGTGDAEAAGLESESRLIETQAEVARLERLVQELQAGDTATDHHAPVTVSRPDGEAAEVEIAQLTAERDRLRHEVEVLSRASGTNRENERIENEMLRERLRDIAARVIHLTGGEVPQAQEAAAHEVVGDISEPQAVPWPQAAPAEPPAEPEPQADAVDTELAPIIMTPRDAVDAELDAPPVERDRGTADTPLPKIVPEAPDPVLADPDGMTLRATAQDRIAANGDGRSTDPMDEPSGMPDTDSAASPIESAASADKPQGKQPRKRRAAKARAQREAAPAPSAEPAANPNSETAPHLQDTGSDDDVTLIDRILRDVEALKESAGTVTDDADAGRSADDGQKPAGKRRSAIS